MKNILLFLSSLAMTFSLRAQDSIPQLQLRSPNDVLWVHLDYLQRDSYFPGLSARAFINGDSIQRVNWAVKLKQIYDGMGLYVQINEVPQDPNYIDSTAKENFYTPFREELPQIYLEKIDSQWFYAPKATRNINKLHQELYPFGTDILVTFFGKKSEKTFLGISVWQYVGVFILIALSLLLYFIATVALRWLIRRLSGIVLAGVPDFVKRTRNIANVASIALVLWFIRLMLPLIQLPVVTTAVFHKGLRIAMTALIILVLLRIVNLLAIYGLSISSQTESRMDDQFVPILKQILKVIVVVLGSLHILQILDFNITALIAGLSIGGLALALAAQDTVKNFLGSVMIFADRPFQIGDFVEGDGFVGTVVEVGFRSTRIKTMNTSIISVPNGNMANASVTNLGARQFRLFNSTIGLTYDTPPDLLEAYIQGIREIMLIHPRVSNEDIYVRFVEFGASSLNIFVRAYIVVATYAEELEVKEEINMAILRWAQELGVNFAFPTTTVQVEQFPGQVNLTPSYDARSETMKQRWANFAGKYRKQLQEAEPGSVNETT